MNKLEALLNDADAADPGYASPAPRAETAAPLARTTPVTAEPQFKERCPKCNGTGSFRSYTGRPVGQCFACKGRGYHARKTSPEQRARVKERAQERKAEALQGWVAANPNEWAWINARAARFEFAAKMAEAIAKYGALTEGQLAAVQRLMARDSERDAQRAQERAQRAARAAVECDPIWNAFYKARENGVRYPKLRLDAFVFKLSAKGPIYITEDGAYLGKIDAGTFRPSYECAPATQERILAVCADPKQAAVAYGQRFGSCSVCGRELTNHTSIEAGIGPICAGKYGW